MTAKKISDINTAAQEDLHAALARIVQQKQTQLFFRHRLASGELRDVEVRPSPVELRGKTLLYSIIHDITEQKQAEDERQRLEAQLYQAQKLETIGTLAGGIAHDFNNILTPIVGFAEMTLDLVQPGSVSEANLRELLTAAARAKELVRQILTFSRREQQERQPILIAPIVKETLRLLRSSLPATIEIRQRIFDDSSAVNADPTQMQQLVMNLATNAYHAMRQDGFGVLEVKLEPVTLTAEEVKRHSGLRRGRYARLIVSDTGPGMDKETLERIFEPFFTTKPVNEGTGLGLSVVHGIITSHSGHIHVESDVGQGTVFSVYLPLINVPHESPVPAAKSLTTLSGHILYVDDEALITSMTKKVLERLGFTVTALTNADRALEIFRERPGEFDLVITDLLMPNITGLQLAESMQRIRPDMPIILTTGNNQDITTEALQQARIRELILKPFNRHTLEQAIRRVLNGVVGMEH